MRLLAVYQLMGSKKAIQPVFQQVIHFIANNQLNYYGNIST